MGDNPELLAWSGTNSGPVVAWNDEKPINRWDDILLLLERLGPDKPLVPEDPAERVQLFGIGREICGELGFGWNRRLDMVRSVDPAAAPSAFGVKYGYREPDASLANGRMIAYG
jgi:glutathione S-transferase